MVVYMLSFSCRDVCDMAKEAEIAAETAFSTVFLHRIDDIERRALSLGTSLTAICKGIGSSRATPDRWRRETPRTVEIVDEMECWVDNFAKKKAHAPDLTEA